MKILHTADWHLGKRLHEFSLLEEQKLFLDWIYEYVNEYNIQYLIVAGDIFDVANPSHEVLHVYYDFLKKFVASPCRLIIVGGNHDSPGLLNAPKELLKVLNIQVVGCAPDKHEDAILPLYNAQQQMVASLAAIPFLYEKDIRKALSGQNADDKLAAIRQGISEHYLKAYQIAETLYPNLPILATGHLYAQGSILSDSEREIQIGNLAGVSMENIQAGFAYIALGHIHKPQKVGGSETIRYAGSPIALSFSEHKDQKICIELSFTGNILTQKDVLIPRFRNLIAWKGTLAEIKKQADQLIWSKYGLSDLIQVEYLEDTFDPKVLQNIGLFHEDIESQYPAHVLLNKIIFKNQAGVKESFILEQEEDDLSTMQVFHQFVQGYTPEETSKLEIAYRSLLEEIENQAKE